MTKEIAIRLILASYFAITFMKKALAG